MALEDTWINLVAWLFFGHCVSMLARWPLTKSKYLISLSIWGIFVWFAHQNSCTRQAYTKTEIKKTIYYDRYVLYRHIYLNMTRKQREQNCSDRQTTRETVLTYICTNCVWLTQVGFNQLFVGLTTFFLAVVRWPKCQVQLTAPGQEGKLRPDRS